VKAYTQLLKQSFAAEQEIKKQYKEYINKSYNQVSRLEKLVSELLHASRIGSGKLQLNISVFELDQLVSEAVSNIRQTSNSHKIILETDGAIKVHADCDRIEQVIVNYLTNAIRYSPKGSEIRVTVKSIGDRAEVRVKDQGIGISKEDQEKVFSRFFRSKEKGKKAGGLGLGLYIVKGIIAQHHGEVSVESEPGKGSCFIFSIPFDQPASS
jgi:signal transduction histidine kinase